MILTPIYNETLFVLYTTNRNIMKNNHVKIVEYFGMPGCGKTTLCGSIKGSAVIANTDIATIKDISLAFRKASIVKKIMSFPWYMLWPLFVLFCKVPFVGRKHLNLYKIPLLRETFYNFAIRYCKYKLIACDHGIAQSLIALIYDNPDSLNEEFLELIKEVVNKTKASELIYCKVKPETALQRIRKRNRQTSGRTDVIKDDKLLLENLYMQEELYESLAGTIRTTVCNKFTEINND